jgi:hypothetical protein
MVVEWCCPLLVLVAGTGCTDLCSYSIIWICHAYGVPGGLYTVENSYIIIIIIIVITVVVVDTVVTTIVVVVVVHILVHS